jgi:hypothetical protein
MRAKSRENRAKARARAEALRAVFAEPAGKSAACELNARKVPTQGRCLARENRDLRAAPAEGVVMADKFAGRLGRIRMERA